jgi:hypothetical protein
MIIKIPDNKKYVEMLWHYKYDDHKLGKKVCCICCILKMDKVERDNCKEKLQQLLVVCK